MSKNPEISPRSGGPASPGSFGADKTAPQTLQLRCEAVKARLIPCGLVTERIVTS